MKIYTSEYPIAYKNCGNCNQYMISCHGVLNCNAEQAVCEEWSLNRTEVCCQNCANCLKCYPDCETVDHELHRKLCNAWKERSDNKMNTDKYNVNLETKTFDSVKNPPYYTEGRQYEPRKVIEDWGLNFYLGNVVKYISRAGRKNVKTQYEDLLKAYQYLEWELDRLRLLDDEEDPSK